MTTFAPGTFSPQPARAPRGKMMAAQGRIETLLFLRHGEQQLLSLVIPVVMLVVLGRLNVTAIDEVVPVMLAIAAMSSGFTGQAIAVAFDRRYGALKRTGASGVPAGVIIAGKIIAVLMMAVIQLVVITIVAMLLGWRPEIMQLIVALPVLLLGVGAFTSMGLLMGGSLSAELVLGLANLIWVVLSAVVGVVLLQGDLAHATWSAIVPSVALASGIADSFGGGVPLLQCGILVLWWVLAAIAAKRWFRFAG